MSQTVKRYEVWYPGVMRESPDGAYVEHSDYLALEAERDRLRELLAGAKGLFEMEPDCATVGTEAWTWLHQTEIALGSGTAKEES